MVNNDFRFVEITDYEPFNTEEILKGLNTVKLIVTPSTSPAFLSDEDVKTALDIASVAIKHFSTIDQKARHSLMEITHLLTLDQPQKKIDQELSVKNLTKVVKLFVESKEINKSICLMSNLLTPARLYMDNLDQETSYRCCIMVKLAIKYFDMLDAISQEILIETKLLVDYFEKLEAIRSKKQIESKQPQAPRHKQSHFLDANKKYFFDCISETFSNFSCENKTVKPSPEAIPKPAIAIRKEPQLPILRKKDAVDKFVDLLSEDYGSASTLFSYTEILTEQTSQDERNLKVFLQPREQAKKDQIALISRLFEGLIKDYVPYLMQCSPESPLYLLNDQIKAQFIKKFPKTALQAFFQEPRNISGREIKLICSVLSKVTMFFQDLNKCKIPAEASLSIEIEQKEIIKRMNVLRGPTKKVIIPDSLDRKIVHQNLLAQAQDLIHNMGKSENSSLERDLETPGLMLSLLVLECFDRAFSPYTFSLIIDRLLEDEIDLADPEKLLKTPPRSQYDASNKNFSETIGTIVVLLAHEIIKSGNPSGVTGAVADVLKFIIERLKITIGENIQKFMNELTNSECTILPILFAQHILFRKEKDGVFKPTLLSQFKRDRDEQAAFQQSVEHRLFQRLFPLILETVKKKSSVAAFFMNNASSVEEFCKTLTTSLWRLSQQEMLLKLLLSYLLEGINEAIVNEK